MKKLDAFGFATRQSLQVQNHRAFDQFVHATKLLQVRCHQLAINDHQRVIIVFRLYGDSNHVADNLLMPCQVEATFDLAAQASENQINKAHKPDPKSLAHIIRS